MAFGLYKPGQGYWVRVMTAVMAGLLTLAASAWLWAQVGLIDLPHGSWRVALSGVPEGVPPPAAGTKLDLIGDLGVAGQGVIGTAEAAEYEQGGGPSGTLTLRGVSITDARLDASMTRTLRGPGGFEATAARPVGIPVIDPVYVQAGAVGAVMVLGAVLIYWLVGVRTSVVEFLIATDGEMKKVNWSNWKDIRGSTIVVVSASFLIAFGLFGVDFVFSAFFKLIGVLQQ